MADQKIRLLILIDWYSPAYKAGGPIQSCRNLVQLLEKDYDIYIYTSDRDWGDKKPFADVPLNQWVCLVDAAKVWYAQPSLGDGQFSRMIREIKPDVIYINSLFSLNFSLKPLWMLHRLRYKGKVVMAPRGMLHHGALAFKSLKKGIFLILFNRFLANKQIFFHATDEQEASDIARLLPSVKNIVQISNVPRCSPVPPSHLPKEKGDLRMIYLSRIHPKKDLLGLIRLLENPLKGKISLDIYGSADQIAYYDQCVKASANVSGGVSINFKGAIPSHQVSEVLREYHVFALFTRGENFGHAIFESFCSGVPVLISDKTPWKDAEAFQAGWIVDPQDATQCLKVLEDILDMEPEVFQQWKIGARSYAESFMNRNNFRESYKRLFS